MKTSMGIRITVMGFTLALNSSVKLNLSVLTQPGAGQKDHVQEMQERERLLLARRKLEHLLVGCWGRHFVRWKCGVRGKEKRAVGDFCIISNLETVE